MKKLLLTILYLVVSVSIFSQNSSSSTLANLNHYHTGNQGIDINLRFGGGLSGMTAGAYGTNTFTKVFDSSYYGSGYNFNGGSSFSWKLLMIDLNIAHATVGNVSEENSIKRVSKSASTIIDTSLGVTWGRQANNPAYGYFFGGLRNWLVNSTVTANNNTNSGNASSLGLVIGVRGLSSSRVSDDLQFLYYGSIAGSLTPLSYAKINEVTIDIATTSWRTLGISIEQGIGFSITRIALSILVNFRTDIIYSSNIPVIDQGSIAKPVYTIAIPWTISLSMQKNFSL